MILAPVTMQEAVQIVFREELAFGVCSIQTTRMSMVLLIHVHTIYIIYCPCQGRVISVMISMFLII